MPVIEMSRSLGAASWAARPIKQLRPRRNLRAASAAQPTGGGGCDQSLSTHILINDCTRELKGRASHSRRLILAAALLDASHGSRRQCASISILFLDAGSTFDEGPERAGPGRAETRPQAAAV